MKICGTRASGELFDCEFRRGSAGIEAVWPPQDQQRCHEQPTCFHLSLVHILPAPPFATERDSRSNAPSRRRSILGLSWLALAALLALCCPCCLAFGIAMVRLRLPEPAPDRPHTRGGTRVGHTMAAL